MPAITGKTHIDSMSASKEQKAKTSGASDLRTVLNLVITAVGVGVLALPRAVAMSGWVCAISLLVLTSLLSVFMIQLLWQCMQLKEGGSSFETYQEIGQACFGAKGQWLVSLCLYLDLAFVCGALFILMGDGMFELVPGLLSRDLWILIFALILLPFCWLPTLKETAWVSALGVTAAFVTLVACVAAGITAASEEPLLGKGYETERSIWPISTFAIGQSFANFMNSYTVAPVVPTLVNSMQNPSHFPKVSAISFGIITVIFGAIGFAGYLGWGESLLSYGSIAAAVSDTQSDGMAVYKKVIQIAILVVCLSHFLVMFNPVAIGMESYCKAALGKERLSLVVSLSLRSLLVFACMGLALAVPNFACLVDLIGATFVMLLQIVFPVVFFFILMRATEKKEGRSLFSSRGARLGTYVVLGSSLVLAAVGIVIGTYMSISEWSRQ